MKLFHLLFAATYLAASQPCDQAQSGANKPIQQAPLLNSCSNLNAQEQAFAANLSAMHMAIFCGCFGSDQRALAMSYMSSSSSTKATGITNDMAVEITIKNCRGMMEMPSSSPMMKQPVQQENIFQPPSSSQKKRSPCSKN